ncbi:hypothetical protein NliqN6_6408 [Naganishia liquefaciens]|uniref:DUF3533 domain-containing protein n=1 Tax=Naganishia liquefaciens TaxID=104408 RepID=A0A8H3TZY4_9TREE|nr:hypothetical protein NliqN6_6408 [Naganishia liquefaciens]
MPLKTSTKQPDGKPQVGLFDPSLKNERKSMFKMVLICFSLITVCAFTLLPVYFGAYYRQTENTYRLTCLILDLDSAASTLSNSPLSPSLTTGAYTAILGPLVTAGAQQYLTQVAPNDNSTYWSLGYQFPSEETLSQFSLPLKDADGQIRYTPGVNASEWAMERVNNQDVWAVVIVNGNATMDALNAVSNGGQQYDPSGAVTFIYTEARNFYAANQYIATQVVSLLNSATQQASRTHALTVLNQAAAGVDGGVNHLTTADPAALTYAFGYNEHNLQPEDQLAGEAATTAGAIYLIILTFLISLVFKPTFEQVRHKLSAGSEVAIKVLAPITGYFWVSLHYSFVSMAFRVDFTRKYGHIGFFLYWMLNWVTMTSLGLVMEFMLEVLGLPFFPFFLLFWVIINVSVAFLDLAAIDHWYSYGFIMPVWNNVDGTKSIMFATKNHLLQNFAVNLAWCVIAGLALIILTLAQRARRSKRALVEEQEKNEGANEKKIRVFW